VQHCLAGFFPPPAISAVIIFALTYLILIGQKLPFVQLDRPSGATIGAVLMIALGVMTPTEAYRDAVDHATLVLLLGMMIIAGYLAEAGFFRWASHRVIRSAGTPRRLLIGLTIVCAMLSALVVNDTVCLMVTPLVVRLIDDAELPPLPFLLAVAFGANAGSAATPTGNPQNMIIVTLSGIPYTDFVASLLPAAMAATAVVLGLLLLLFRKELDGARLSQVRLDPPPLDRPLLVKGLVALLGVVVGFLAGFDLAFTALAGGAFLMLVARRAPRRVLLRVDWLLLLFFAALFVVVHGVGTTGLLERAFARVAPFATGSPLREASVLATSSVVGSNLFSNVPFVMLAARFIPSFTDPTLAWKVLALSSTLAGNLTLVGSVANLIVFEAAGAKGHVSFSRFLRYGLPITALSCATGVAVLLLLR